MLSPVESDKKQQVQRMSQGNALSHSSSKMYGSEVRFLSDRAGRKWLKVLGPLCVMGWIKKQRVREEQSQYVPAPSQHLPKGEKSLLIILHPLIPLFNYFLFQSTIQLFF